MNIPNKPIKEYSFDEFIRVYTHVINDAVRLCSEQPNNRSLIISEHIGFIRGVCSAKGWKYPTEFLDECIKATFFGREIQ